MMKQFFILLDVDNGQTLICAFRYPKDKGTTHTNTCMSMDAESF